MAMKRQLTLWTQRIFLLSFLWSSVSAVTFLLEAEQYVKDRIAYPRTQASGIWSVHFYQNERFPIEFCLQSSTTITVSDVRYSNDGDSDYVEVKLDGQRLGTFESHRKSGSGDNWNRFEHTGAIGHPVSVHAGKHVLELVFVSTDRHGIELDFVALDVEDDAQDERLLQCTAYCDSTINYSPTLVSDSLPTGWLHQRSYRTACAAERNVRIALYHPALLSYRVTAHPPRYKTLLNDHPQDFVGCVGTETGRAIWLFNNFHVLPSTEQMQFQSSATLTFSGDNFSKNTKMTIAFASPDLSPTGPGAVLALKFRRTTTDVGTVHVLLEKTVNGTVKTEEKIADPSESSSEVSWNIEPEVLQGQGQLEVTLTIVHKDGVMLHADYLRLGTRPQAEIIDTVYRDTMTMVETFNIPDGSGGDMTVYRPDNTQTWPKMDGVRVLKKVSWSEEFEEIFRLDQDGTMRLKPRAFYASDAPPFGTAVVIGPSDPASEAPAAPIKRIDIDPWALKFTLTYIDGSITDMLVRSGSFGVRAIVTHVRTDPASRARPVAVVTSTWVADGKADVDHVSADGAEPREVLSGWERLYGTSFAFFRQCVSRHNTQAPDITLELLKADPSVNLQVETEAGTSNMI